LTELQPLTVLTGTDLSKKRMTIELSKYALLQGADVIILATHGRKGIKRWMLGSFAESLIRESKTPLFIINPHWNPSDQFNHILFPTDFSDVSRDAFLKVVDFAQSSELPMTLFHKTSLTTSPEQQVSSLRTRALNWAAEASAHGVALAVSIDEDWSESVADAVLNKQRKTGGIIALASRSGETSRKIALSSSSAVWVLYPEAKTETTGLNQAA
jgi:nucleotide-binding universal stress UspA family protein